MSYIQDEKDCEDSMWRLEISINPNGKSQTLKKIKVDRDPISARERTKVSQDKNRPPNPNNHTPMTHNLNTRYIQEFYI